MNHNDLAQLQAQIEDLTARVEMLEQNQQTQPEDLARQVVAHVNNGRFSPDSPLAKTQAQRAPSLPR